LGQTLAEIHIIKKNISFYTAIVLKQKKFKTLTSLKVLAKTFREFCLILGIFFSLKVLAKSFRETKSF